LNSYQRFCMMCTNIIYFWRVSHTNTKIKILKFSGIWNNGLWKSCLQ